MLGGTLALATMASLAPVSEAADGHYTVVQCGKLNRTSNEATQVETASYTVRSLCDNADQEFAIKIRNVDKSPEGRSGQVYWQSPAGTSIVGAKAEVKLFNYAGHHAQLFVADASGRQIREIADGDQSNADDWKTVQWNGGSGARRLVLRMRCVRTDGCNESEKPRAMIRAIRMTVEDHEPPVLDLVSGSLLDPGWLAGDRGLEVKASDLGSGLSQLEANVNGVPTSSALTTCDEVGSAGATASSFAACQSDGSIADSLSTENPPFVDGANDIGLCAVDFAGNNTCRDPQVRIDNVPPTAAFTSQSVQDPELIRAEVDDATSGVTAGEISYRAKGDALWTPIPTQLSDGYLKARVDSSAVPAGQYEFQVQATDAADNSATSVNTTDGVPKVLDFPLRSRVEIESGLTPGRDKRKVVSYSRNAHIRGRVVDAFGRPLANRRVKVVEHFGSGSLLSTRVRHPVTNSHGVFSEHIPHGPSRRITASYGGDQRYLPAKGRVGRLVVRSLARFHVSRHRVKPKHRVAFFGRIGRRGARIPPKGKLLEVQVKRGPKSWITVKHVFSTNRAGRYRIRYRFQGEYPRSIRYSFRIRVAPEQGWPYKAPAKSRIRNLVVKASKHA